MRFLKATPLVAVLALAACGEQQTAEAPGTTEQQTTATAPAPGGAGGTTAEAPPPGGAAGGTSGAGGQTAVITPDQQLPGEPNVTVTESGATGAQQQATAEPPPAGGAGGAASPGQQTLAQAPAVGEATGAVGGAGQIPPGAYQSDQLALELTEAGAFQLTGPGGENVQGDYQMQGDTLTLTNATGATGGVTFPMTCQVAPEGQGFRVTAQDPSCQMLDGQVFQPQG